MQIFQRDFTGVNGDRWTAHGFTRLVGVGDLTHPVIQANTGWGPALGSSIEQVLRASAYPSGSTYKALLDLMWKDAAGAGRVAGLAVRAQSDGRMYVAQVDSNIGSTRVRLRRRTTTGSWVDVVPWQAATAASASLNAGVTLQVIATNDDPDTVRLKVRLFGVDEIEATHGGNDAILSAGTAAAYLGANCAADDVVFDNLVVYDLQDESASGNVPGAYDAGLVLVVDGFYYTEDEWSAEGLVPLRAVQSFDLQASGSLRDLERFDEPLLRPGQWVEFILDGVHVARGVLRQVSTTVAPGEGTQYLLHSPKQLAAEVIIWNPDDSTGDISFNASGSPADQADMTVGKCIAYVVDHHLEGDGRLRDVGAAPASGAAYIQGEIDAMDAVVPDLRANGDVLRSVESLLSYTSRALWIDPGDRMWHFVDRSASNIATIDLANDHIVGQVSIDPNKAFTAVVMRGAEPQVEEQVLSFKAGDLEPDWDPGLEPAWSSMAADKERDFGAVSAAGIDTGHPYMDPDLSGEFSMVSKEWEVTGRVTFTNGAEIGNSYAVQTNSGSRFVFKEVAWLAGGPANGDPFTVEGNQLKNVYAKFKLTDPDKSLAESTCVQFKMVQGRDEFLASASIDVPSDNAEPVTIKVDRPAVPMVDSNATTPCGETVLGPTYADMPDIVIQAPVINRALGTPAAPYLREPASGWRGTAYSADAAKWNGGGDSSTPGVKRELALNEAAYISATQEAEYRKVAAEILKITGTLARTGRFAIAGLEAPWAVLNWRLQVQRTGDTTGLENVTDLWGLGTEYDFTARTTTLIIGTMSSGQYDLAGLRARMNTKINRVTTQNYQKLLDEIYKCLNDMASKPAPVTRSDPGPICAKKIVTPGNKKPGGPGKVPPDVTIWVWIDILIEMFVFLFDAFLGKQKGVTLDGIGDDGSITLGVPGAAGGTVTIDPDGTITDGEGNDVDPDDVIPTNPDPADPDGAGMPGWYGQIWDVLLALLGNLGKSITIDASGPAGDPGGVTIGKPGEPAGDGTTWVAPCSEKDDPAGVAIPAGGDGGVIPANATTQDHAIKDALGLEPVTMRDPGGEVWLAVESGNMYRPEPQTDGSYADGATWEQVIPATGGPGHGKNGGDYETDPTGAAFEVPSGVFAESKPTGLVDGGELNIVNGTDVQVIGGFGVIIDSYSFPAAQPTGQKVEWATITQPIILPYVAGRIVHFSIDNAGHLVQRTHLPSPAEMRDEIYLGYAIHNGTEWGEVSSPVVVNNVAHALYEYLDSVAGPTFIQSGGDVTEETGFALHMAEAIIWEQNRNWHVNKRDPHRETLQAQAPMQLRYVTTTFATEPPRTSIDPTRYESPLGTVTAIGGGVGATTIQRVFLDARDNVWVLFGQAVWTSFDDAMTNLGVDEAAVVIPDFLRGAVLLGYVVTERAETEWKDGEAHFVTSSEASGGGGGSGAPGATLFLDLTDTPSGYLAGVVQVKPGLDGLEFHILTAADVGADALGSAAAVGTLLDTHKADYVNPHLTKFTGLGDSPGAYAGAAGRLVAVNTSEDGVEFVDAASGGASWPWLSVTLSHLILNDRDDISKYVSLDRDLGNDCYIYPAADSGWVSGDQILVRAGMVGLHRIMPTAGATLNGSALSVTLDNGTTALLVATGGVDMRIIVLDAAGGAGGAVDSVFGRAGAVVALAADYAAHYDSLGNAAAVSALLDTHEADYANPHKVTALQAGAASQADLDAHANSLANPHAVTAAQAGADVAGAAAAVQTNLDTHEADVTNPHATTHLLLPDGGGIYTGHGGKVVAVKASEDGLEYVDGGGGAPQYSTPHSISRHAGADVSLIVASSTFVSLGNVIQVSGLVSGKHYLVRGHIGVNLKRASGGSTYSGYEFYPYALNWTDPALGPVVKAYASENSFDTFSIPFSAEIQASSTSFNLSLQARRTASHNGLVAYLGGVIEIWE